MVAERRVKAEPYLCTVKPVEAVAILNRVDPAPVRIRGRENSLLHVGNAEPTLASPLQHPQ